jgi:hypothetical protein
MLDRNQASDRLLRTAPFVFGALMCVAPATAQAQSLNDKYWFDIAGYWPDVNTTVEVASKTHPNVATKIDMESDLDLASRQVLPSFDAGTRLGKFVLAFEYYGLNRSGSRSITKDIVFDDVTYQAGATVASKFDSNIYRVLIGYSFLKTKDYELGAGLGGHVTDFTIDISGNASVNTVPPSAVSSTVRHHHVLAPVPTLSLYGGVSVTKGLQFNARVDWLSLKIDKYNGKILNLQGGFTYNVHKNIGLGLLYRYVDYKLGVNQDTWTGQVNYKFNGPSLVLHVGFQ